MRRVLLAYELGAGLGHLNRLLAVARRLSGHTLVFALPDMSLEPVVRRALDQAEVRAGVSWPPPADLAAARRVPTHTLGDVLRLFGLEQPERVARAVHRWRGVLDAVRPDVVVADFAPALRLATRSRVPLALVGNGYTVPPGGRVLAPLRPWDDAVPAASRRHEAEVLASLNQVAADLSAPSVDHVADVFQGDVSFVCTLAEFDPYRPVRTDPVHWPFNIPDIRPGPPVAERTGAPLFAYFQASHPAVATAVEALNRGGRRATLYVDGADPSGLAARCAPLVGVHRRPADFAAVLPGTRGMLHHGGLGTASAGLMAGVPQIVCPLNLEHALTARGLEAFGAAITLPSAPTPAALAGALARVLDEGEFAAAAGRAANELQRRRDPDAVAPVAAAVAAL